MTLPSDGSGPYATEVGQTAHGQQVAPPPHLDAELGLEASEGLARVRDWQAQELVEFNRRPAILFRAEEGDEDLIVHASLNIAGHPPSMTYGSDGIVGENALSRP